MIKKLLGGTALFLMASGAFANECEVTVESNDAMQFNTSNVVIPASCSEFTVTLSTQVSYLNKPWAITG